MTTPKPFKRRNKPFETVKDWTGGTLSSSGSSNTMDSFATSGAPCTLDENSQSTAEKMRAQLMEHENERQLLQDAEEERSCLKQKLDEAQREMQNNERRNFLVATRQTHGVELEYIQLQSEKHQCETDRDDLQRECETLEKEIEEQQADRLDELNCMGEQLSKQQVYQHCLELQIRSHHSALGARQAKVDMLKTLAQTMDDESDWKMQQAQACQREAKRLRSLEQDKNEAIEQLGSAVRAQLTRRQELRKSLYQAQQDHRRANDELSAQERRDE